MQNDKKNNHKIRVNLTLSPTIFKQLSFHADKKSLKPGVMARIIITEFLNSNTRSLDYLLSKKDNPDIFSKTTT
jgi:hypothetical protein